MSKMVLTTQDSEKMSKPFLGQLDTSLFFVYAAL
jgi:hypothetical protein